MTFMFEATLVAEAACACVAWVIEPISSASCVETRWMSCSAWPA
jgi:hypothetical protein